MRKLLVLLSISALAFLIGCTNKEFQSDYPIVYWEGVHYVVTHEPIMKDQLEEQIGEITSETSELPTEHGEGFKLTNGIKLYKIKDIDITSAIESLLAVEIEGKYRVARRLVLRD